MPRYEIDPNTGEKVKISGTNYIPPCLAKTAAKKAAFIPEPIVETTKDADETTHESID
jgi:hypothetical protein